MSSVEDAVLAAAVCMISVGYQARDFPEHYGEAREKYNGSDLLADLELYQPCAHRALVESYQ